MATNLTLTTAYVGEVFEEILLQLSTGAPSLQGGHFAVHNGIRKKKYLPKLTATNLVQARAVTPSSQGSYTITEAALTPQEAMVYLEINPRDWEDFWGPYQPSGELNFRTLPPNVQIPFLTEVMNEVNEWLEPKIWTGNGTPPQPYGIKTRALADATVLDVSTPITLTSGNIVSELERGWALVPEAVKMHPDCKIFVSVASRELYRQAQQNQTSKGVDFTSGGLMTFNGRPIIPLVGFPDDSYIITYANTSQMGSNLHMGCDWNEDSKDVLVVDKLQANSELYFVKMNFKIDFAIKWGAEMVLYGA